jgi:hypothetical protein
VKFVLPMFDAQASTLRDLDRMPAFRRSAMLWN